MDLRARSLVHEAIAFAVLSLLCAAMLLATLVLLTLVAADAGWATASWTAWLQRGPLLQLLLAGMLASAGARVNRRLAPPPPRPPRRAPLLTASPMRMPRFLPAKPARDA